MTTLNQSVSVLVPWYAFPPFRKDGIGGLSVAVWDAATKLSELGAQVTLLVPGNEEHIRYVEGVRVVAGRVGKSLAVSHTLSDQEKLFFAQFDVVLSVNNYGSGSLRALRGVKVIRQIHTVAADRPLSSYLPLTPRAQDYVKMTFIRHLERRREKELKGRTTLCVSEFVRSLVTCYGLEREQNTHFVPNGYREELFRPDLAHSESYDILFVGRFQHSKGLDILLQALQRLSCERLNLCIVGGFDERERRLITTWSGDRVRLSFAGSVSRKDIPGYYASSKLVVVPSRYESFGLPVLEALACGVPVIATNVGGIPEIVNGESILLTEPDSRLFGQKLEKFFHEPDHFIRVTNRLRTHLSRYAWSHVGRVLLNRLTEEGASCKP